MKIIIVVVLAVFGLGACGASTAVQQALSSTNNDAVVETSIFEYFGDNGCYVANPDAARTAGYTFEAGAGFGVWQESTLGLQVALGGPANGGTLGWAADDQGLIYGPTINCAVAY